MAAMSRKKAVPDPNDQWRLIDIRELADYLGVSVQRIYTSRVEGKGPKAVKVGKLLRYRWSDVNAWCDSQLDDSVAS